jgi:hypothetical protein
MKAYKSMLAGLAVLAMALSVPVWAEMVSVSDSDLAGISGKDNLFTFAGETSSSQSANDDSSANIQVGWYQWADNHSADTTNQKASNYFSSGSAEGNSVQQNAVAAINAITWGATGNGQFTAASISGGDFTNMDYAVMAVGGF